MPLVNKNCFLEIPMKSKEKTLALTASASTILLFCGPFSVYAMDAVNAWKPSLAIDGAPVNSLRVYKAVEATVHSHSLLSVDNGTPSKDAFDPSTNLLTVNVTKPGAQP